MTDLPPEDADLIGRLRREDLLPLVGQTFAAEELEQGFVLHRLEDLTRDDEPAADREPFSALFLHPGGPHFPQQIYHLHHPDVGRLPLFLVPVGVVGEEGLYEAILR